MKKLKRYLIKKITHLLLAKTPKAVKKAAKGEKAPLIFRLGFRVLNILK